MAKASMTLPDGTIVNIDGSPEEIRRILAVHQPELSEEKKSRERGPKPPAKSKRGHSREEVPDLQSLVNTTKTCKEFDHIEANILDRSSVVDRLLVPLYVAHQYVSDQIALTSGEIRKYLSQFGVNIAQPNIAKNLSSTASRYVMGDSLREKGKPVRYRISRKGLAYLKTVIAGKSDG